MLSIPRLLPLAIASLLLASQPAASTQDAGSGSADQVPAFLETTIFPRLEFRAATPAEAFSFLAAKARQFGAERLPEARFPIVFDPAQLPDALVTVTLANVSLIEAIRTTAAIAGMRVVVATNEVRLEPTGTGKLPRLGSPIDAAALSPAQRTLLAKAARLVIPRVEFREATIREATDFLRLKSREADSEVPKPALRGTNIVLLHRPSARPDTMFADVRLTMSLQNASLHECLRQIAEFSGSKLRVSDSAIILDFTDSEPSARKGNPVAVPGL